MPRRAKVTRAEVSRHVCKGCGKLYAPKTRKQKYCNEKCREDYYKRHYFIKEVVNKTCPNCGITFPTSKPKRQIYCNPECREDAKAKRMDALSASATAERVTYLDERMAAFERSDYKCTVCGRGVIDGAILDVAEDGAKLTTMCTDCKAGRSK